MKYSLGTAKKVIAVCMAKFNGIDQMDLIKNFYKAAQKHGLKLFIFSSSADFATGRLPISETQIYELIEPERFDAVVIVPDTFKSCDSAQKIAEKAIKRGVPCISLLEETSGCYNVLFDYVNAFEQVVCHIIEEHHVKNVNFLAGIKGNPYSEHRLSVFKKVMEENGLLVEEDRIGYGDFWEEPAGREMERFLASGKKIDAVICANDFMAMEACKRLREAGLSVPDDVIVSGFDGIEFEKYHYPRLTTVYHDTYEMSEKICEMVDSLSSGMEIKPTVRIGCSFRKGQSCGCSKDYVKKDFERLGFDLYKAYRNRRLSEGDVEEIYQKVENLGSRETLPEIYGELAYLINRFSPGADFDLLLNNDFLSEDMHLSSTLKSFGPQRVSYYTDEMRVPVHVRDGVLKNPLSEKRGNLLPDLKDMIEKDGVVLFVPIGCQGNGVGYSTLRFEPESLDFFIYFIFLSNITNILNMHKSRLDQINLYSVDQLTQLLNRKGFYRHMEKPMYDAVNEKLPVAVLSVDMNGLKYINDTFGHKEGDFALAKIGAALSFCVEKNGIASRFGGDEFVVAYVGPDSVSKCEEAAEKIRKNLAEFNKAGIKEYVVCAAIGMASTVPSGLGDLEHLISEADERMYSDKQAYKKEHPEYSR